MIRLKDGRPRSWIAEGGRPCAAIRKAHDGLPAYESDHGTLHVMESLVVNRTAGAGAPVVLPLSYPAVALRAPGDLTALHDAVDAVWSWRPLIYYLGDRQVIRFGSQQELEWRRARYEYALEIDRLDEESDRVIAEQVARLAARYGGKVPRRLKKNTRKRLHREYLEQGVYQTSEPLPYVLANGRANAILRENLAPQQRLDLAVRNAFFVRGHVNRLYCVRLGNGFSIVDPVTHDETVSLCLHPDSWMPHADVALATKLAIDSGQDGEAELLGAARPRLSDGRAATPDDRVAHRLEERYRLAP